MEEPTRPPCPLCHDERTTSFLAVEGQTYWRCACCALTFLDPSAWLSREQERAEYERHENTDDDARYRSFLSKLAIPLLERLDTAASGLDYGCGPGHALAAMLRAAGHEVALYDPFFEDDASVLLNTYDFIACTETVEHFHHPGLEFDRLDQLLRPGGWLAVMTCFQTEDERFANWHYRRDPTHVVFYREQTMRRLARLHRWSCDVPVKDVVLFRKELLIG